MIYLICLDEAPVSNAGERIEAWVRGNFRHWTRPLAPCWIVDGPLAAEQIHTALTPMLSSDDRLIIVKAATEAMWHGLGEPHARWIADRFPGSISERIAGETEGLTS